MGTTTFRYDPWGRRIQKSSPLGTTNYLYDGSLRRGWNVVEEVGNSGNVLARYTQGQVMDQPLAELRSGTTSYYHQDALGSITSLSNGVGALANTYSYDSFGKLTASTGALTNPFQYTGREFDPETGIYQYRARYYDQSGGRFISEDPIAFRGGVDFYVYVRNNPTDLIDPTGLQDSVTGSHAQCDKDPDQGRRCKCHCSLMPIGDTTQCEAMCNDCYKKNMSPKETCLCVCTATEQSNCKQKCCGLCGKC